VKRFVLCLGYKGEVIRDYFVNYRQNIADLEVKLVTGDVNILNHRECDDWNVVLADTGQNAMTGARIKRALKYVDNDHFFATYGDGVSDIDLHGLYQHHLDNKKLATVTAVRPSSRFGEISVEQGSVTAFEEKPQVSESWINGGFFVFDKKVFDSVPDDEGVVLETSVLNKLASDGQLSAYKHPGFWQCMDTIRETQVLNQMIKAGNAPWIKQK